MDKWLARLVDSDIESIKYWAETAIEIGIENRNYEIKRDENYNPVEAVELKIVRCARYKYVPAYLISEYIVIPFIKSLGYEVNKGISRAYSDEEVKLYVNICKGEVK